MRRTLKAVIFDDEPSVLTCMRLLLQRRGYEVLAYGEPVNSPLHQCHECPCTLQGGCPDLIISDIDMPVVNGVELLESLLKKGCRCHHLALISGKGIPESDLTKVTEHGALYFTKPLDLTRFYAWLDRVELTAGSAA